MSKHNCYNLYQSAELWMPKKEFFFCCAPLPLFNPFCTSHARNQKNLQGVCTSKFYYLYIFMLLFTIMLATCQLFRMQGYCFSDTAVDLTLVPSPLLNTSSCSAFTVRPPYSLLNLILTPTVKVPQPVRESAKGASVTVTWLGWNVGWREYVTCDT